MPSNITIFGAPLNNLLHIAAGLEAVGITHQLPEDDAPAGAVLNATDRLRAKVMALHAELSVCATYWAEDGAEGIEGAEPLSNGDEDDAGEEWQGE